MPFPWKKKRGSRISQLVADRFNQSTHGASLVVQTGFPTSIIDLFHKNRDRLKKSANKKRSDSLSCCDLDSQLAMPDSLVKLPSQEIELVTPERSIDAEIELVDTERCLMNRIGDDLVSGEERFDAVVEDRSSVFVAVMKVLFMVVLALVTKRLVVGVSVSAFSLFLLEYVGKYVYGMSKSYSDYKKTMKGIVDRVLCFVGIKRVIESDCRDLKVQSVEIEPELYDKAEAIVCVDSDRGLEFEKIELKNLDLEKEDEHKQEVSKSGRMKTKMRKLVGKKFGKSRRKGSESKCLVPELTQGDTYIERDQSTEVKQIKCDVELFEDKINTSDISSDQGELRSSKSEGCAEEARRETIWILKYWVICLIVLSGLIGGRVFAIVFTLMWCLILKPSGNNRDAHASFIQKSSGTACG